MAAMEQEVWSKIGFQNELHEYSQEHYRPSYSEHITMAAVRLWKRLKQGEYSFFPNYTGHGLPQIPLSAMPRDVPTQFPFERRGIVKSSQSCPGAGYAPSVSPQSYDSPKMPPEYSIASPGYLPVPCSILTPPPSDNSSSFSDSFSSNDSLLAQPYNPIFAEPPQQPRAGTPPTVSEESLNRAPPQDNKLVEHHFDPSILTEFLLPLEEPLACSQPPASPAAPTTPRAIESDLGPAATFLKPYSDLGVQVHSRY
ncbi:hypothetical protein OSTOST_19310 [Ostertagia ostertagi]